MADRIPRRSGYADYAKAMKAMYNQEPEAGAVQVYACLQIVQQAIEKVGEIDRKKIRDEIAKGGKDTLWGDITWKNQLNANPGRLASGKGVRWLASSRPTSRTPSRRFSRSRNGPRSRLRDRPGGSHSARPASGAC